MTYKIKNRRLFVDVEDTGDFEYFSQNIYISQVEKSLLTGEETITLVIEFATHDLKIVKPRDILGKNIIAMLLNFGFSCVDSSQNREILQCILLDSEAKITKTFVHNTLCFAVNADGEEIFLHHHQISTKKQKNRSTYTGENSVVPFGSLLDWKNGLKKHVYAKGYMELALAIGAVAPIAHLLMQKNVITEMPMIAFIGLSSSGKTTALKLSSSIWFSPKMIGDFNCTQNAFVCQLSQSRGIPIYIDEASAVPDWDFTSLLYNLPKGKSKLRCKNDGTLQPRKYFSGCIVFTGESSLFNQASKNSGLQARLLELTLPWTEDAEHALNVSTFFGSHYGTAAEPLIRWILSHKDEIVHYFQDCHKTFGGFFSTSSNNSVFRRLLNIPAMILTAAYVLNSSLNLSLDEAVLTSQLYTIMSEKHENMENEPEKIYEEIKTYILSNQSKFPNKENLIKQHSIWGYQDLYRFNSIVWIRKDIFENLIKEITTLDLTQVKKILSKEKILFQSESRHYTKKIRINQCSVDCYGVFLTYPPKNLDKNFVKKRTNLLSAN